MPEFLSFLSPPSKKQFESFLKKSKYRSKYHFFAGCLFGAFTVFLLVMFVITTDMDFPVAKLLKGAMPYLVWALPVLAYISTVREIKRIASDD